VAKALTVKIATSKVIKALEAKIVQLNSDFANQEAKEVEYQANYEAYKDALKDFAITHIDKAVNLRTQYRTYNGALNIDFDVPATEAVFPVEPKRDFEVLYEWKIKEMVEEINSALNILRMTDDEYVNASTMKSIAQYL
jgi:hypothetical protein